MRLHGLKTGVLVCVFCLTAQAEQLLLDSDVLHALSEEVSGATAKRNLEYVATQHRMRGSRGFEAAAHHLAEQAESYGLQDVTIERYPADGEIFYGTQRSRPPWDVDFAELWDVSNASSPIRIASWETMPVRLAQDSESGQVEAELVDVGNGTSEADYQGKDVQGKLVLVASQPGAPAPLAVDTYGAAGLISYAQNQRTGWWKENENLVRWGHLGTFAETPSFAFMLSLKEARAFQARLAAGETVRLKASVEACKHAGDYQVLSALIPGSELPDEEIVYSCHLDHQRPGANDNASGCVTILEVARSLAKLIREGSISQPKRSLRFVWPPEIEGTLTRLVSLGDEGAEQIKAAIHLDMVGGGPNTKATFHVTRGPASVPSFVNDVAEHFAVFVNQQSAQLADGGNPKMPLLSNEGDKDALRAETVPFTMGSDHQIYAEGSFSIPSIYMNDWPDRFIHTNFDVPGNVDATKLKRVAFIAAASGLFLANMDSEDLPAVGEVIRQRSLVRAAELHARRHQVSGTEQVNLLRQTLRFEHAVAASVSGFAVLDTGYSQAHAKHMEALGQLLGYDSSAGADSTPESPIYQRNPSVTGPMGVFGYNYFGAHYPDDAARPGLLDYQGLWGGGGEYAYEVLNLVNGVRTAAEIRDLVSATYGPVSQPLVVEYLQALETIQVINTIEGLPD